MYIRIKRGIDFILSLMATIILSPLFLLLALWIKLDSPGPVFFKQKRVGIHKTHFNILKFRTMRTDTPKDMPTHQLQNPEQYITKSGRFLRKTSLDELPQIFNILKGEMSIIGPRPALWNQYDLIEERDKYGANQVMPGITGWAQINGRDELEIPVKARLDGEYVEKMSFRFDVKCFFGTITAVLKSDGVVEGGTGKKKKILIITNHSYMFWRFRKELTEELLKKYEVVISTPFTGHEKDLENLGCKMIETQVDRRGINPFTDMKLLRHYSKLIKTEEPNMVITYSIKPNIYAGLVCKRKGIPYCANVQGLGTAFQKKRIADIATRLYRMAMKKVHVVFFENEDNAKVFLDKRIIGESRVVVLPGAGINLDYYRMQPMEECSKKDADCVAPVCGDEADMVQDKNKVHFLYLGRIMREKGIDEIFYAIRKLHTSWEDKFVLDLVGFFEDEYKDQVEQLEKEGVVVFHGFKQDPRPYYAAADCVVLPSYHEGMSNVLLEAAAMGRAIIASNIPGCKEAVVENVSGYLCKRKDGEGLLAKMEDFMRLSREARKDMGLAGRKHMEEHFAKEVVVKKTMEYVYRGLGEM